MAHFLGGFTYWLLTSDKAAEDYRVSFHSLLSSLLSCLRMKKRNGISLKHGCHIQPYPTGIIFDSYPLRCEWDIAGSDNSVSYPIRYSFLAKYVQKVLLKHAKSQLGIP